MNVVKPSRPEPPDAGAGRGEQRAAALGASPVPTPPTGDARPERAATDAVARDEAPAGEVAAAEIVTGPLDEAAAAELVARSRAGAVVTFTGAVRDHDGGRDVAALSYSAHPDARARLAEIAAGIAARDGVCAVVARHRVGDLAIGDAALVVAVSAEHRGQAFAAAADLVDEIKAGVPIWKHQAFTDGDTEWVGLP